MRTFAFSPSIFFPLSFFKTIFKTIFVVNFFFLWILIFLYIVEVGLYTKEVYLQGKYQKEIAEISKEIDLLSIEFAKSSSLSNIENYFKEDSFVKINPQQVKYIQIFEQSLATK